MMTHIATPRLLLRPPRGGDEDALVRGLNNFNVSQWTARIPYPYGPEDAARFLEIAAGAEPGMLRLAITLGGELIGGIGIEAGEIGYWIAEPQWGKGYGGEAARAITDHAFSGMGMEALKARYRLGNTASRRILLGLGFVETGEIRGHSLATGGGTELMALALSRADWQKARERQR